MTFFRIKRGASRNLEAPPEWPSRPGMTNRDWEGYLDRVEKYAKNMGGRFPREAVTADVVESGERWFANVLLQKCDVLRLALRSDVVESVYYNFWSLGRTIGWIERIRRSGRATKSPIEIVLSALVREGLISDKAIRDRLSEPCIIDGIDVTPDGDYFEFYDPATGQPKRLKSSSLSARLSQIKKKLTD